MIPNTRQIFHSPTPHYNHGVVLQVVAFTRHISYYLAAVTKPHLGHLPKRRVGLFRCGGIHSNTNTATKRRAAQRGRLAALAPALSPFSNELIYCCHARPSPPASSSSSAKPRTSLASKARAQKPVPTGANLPIIMWSLIAETECLPPDITSSASVLTAP